MCTNLRLGNNAPIRAVALAFGDGVWLGADGGTGEERLIEGHPFCLGVASSDWLIVHRCAGQAGSHTVSTDPLDTTDAVALCGGG